LINGLTSQKDVCGSTKDRAGFYTKMVPPAQLCMFRIRAIETPCQTDRMPQFYWLHSVSTRRFFRIWPRSSAHMPPKSLASASARVPYIRYALYPKVCMGAALISTRCRFLAPEGMNHPLYIKYQKTIEFSHCSQKNISH
jgi:hypothetical protein